MKIRSDFVTNSSSSNYTFSLYLVGENGAHIPVEETAYSTERDDDDETNFWFELERGTLEGVRQLALEHSEIAEAVRFLQSKIIWHDLFEDDWEDPDSEQKKPVLPVSNQKINYEAIGEKADQIRYIATRKTKHGRGEETISLSYDIVDPFLKRYAEAETKEARDAVVEEATHYVLSKPKWFVSGEDEGWDATVMWPKDDIRESIGAALEYKTNGSYNHYHDYWDGEVAEYTFFDVKTGKTEEYSEFYVESYYTSPPWEKPDTPWEEIGFYRV